ncbi:MAG: histidinol dehydrogenase [Candidatus Omnitrophica bacterium]|nr:histidinol dehydrogenase [Candidatus Omnitrophota bacterium]
MKRLDLTQSLKPIEDFLAQRKADSSDVAEQVEAIREQVRSRGWEAIAEYTEKFDGVKKEPKAEAFQVSQSDFDKACEDLDSSLAEAIQVSIDRVRNFHSRQKRQDWFLDEEGIRTGQLFRPLSRVGVYAPAGTAPLFSTLVMDTVPAQVAGCPSMVICSPPQKSSGTVHPLILGTSGLLGLEPGQIFAIGGAWAVFAMAYGLPGFERTNGIFGPGNQYVMEAKKQIQGEVKIESLPGNSEILVIADDTANPRHVAADLLSQAEHAGGEMSILVTPSEKLLNEVDEQVKDLLSGMERKEIAASSLKTGGVLALVKNLDQACEVANIVAAEHLEIQTEDSEKLIDKIEHAGAIFVGPWSTEPIGDYTAGTNHVLPTGGNARYSSALSVDDYMKKISVVHVKEQGIKLIGPPAMKLAEAEGLTGHKKAISLRLGEG